MIRRRCSIALVARRRDVDNGEMCKFVWTDSNGSMMCNVLTDLQVLEEPGAGTVAMGQQDKAEKAAKEESGQVELSALDPGYAVYKTRKKKDSLCLRLKLLLSCLVTIAAD